MITGRVENRQALLPVTYRLPGQDVKSAIAFHMETFGPEVLENEEPILEVFVAEARVAV